MAKLVKASITGSVNDPYNTVLVVSGDVLTTTPDPLDPDYPSPTELLGVYQALIGSLTAPPPVTPIPDPPPGG